MLKRKFLILTIFLGLILTFTEVLGQETGSRDLLTGGLSSEQLEKMLMDVKTWHPFAQYDERNKWQQLPGEERDSLVKTGEEALKYQWPVLPASLYLEFSRNGNRSHYEAVYFERRRKLAALALAELVEGQGRFIDQIINGVWAICEETSWCIPAHISLQKAGFTPLPRYDDTAVDLFTAETSATLSWTYYFFKDEFDKVTPEIGRRIEYEINRRIIAPTLERSDFWWMGFGDRKNLNNWTPWIVSNWLTTSLIMEKNPDRRAKSVFRAMQCLDNFLNIYPADGGCDEGPGYWSVAGGSLFDCLELLFNASAGKINLYQNALIHNIGSYIDKVYISDPYYINFADASAKIHPNADIIYRFGDRVSDETMKEFAAYVASKEDFNGYSGGNSLGRMLNAVFSYEKVKNYQAKEPLIDGFWLPDIEVFGARSQAGTVKGLYLAGKGGNNAESHNHNDVGNFIVYYNGQPVIIDVGVEEYRKETFSKDRYKIWTMQSQYHTLPTINDVMQEAGGEFKAQNVQYKAGKSRVEFSLDIAKAYPESAGVIHWYRNLDFRRGKSIHVSEDYVLKKVEGEIYLSFMTPCKVVVENGRILFQHIGQEDHFDIALNFNPQQFNIETDDITIDDRRLEPVWGEHLTRIRLILKNPALTDKLNYEIKAVD